MSKESSSQCNDVREGIMRGQITISCDCGSTLFGLHYVKDIVVKCEECDLIIGKVSDFAEVSEKISP